MGTRESAIDAGASTHAIRLLYLYVAHACAKDRIMGLISSASLLLAREAEGVRQLAVLAVGSGLLR